MINFDSRDEWIEVAPDILQHRIVRTATCNVCGWKYEGDSITVTRMEGRAHDNTHP